MAIQDMTTQHRGLGQWTVTTYNPNIVIGPIEGYLTVGKDFHIIFKDERNSICLFNVPSQNVAFVLNSKFVSDEVLGK
jgi:hypothetical protein